MKFLTFNMNLGSSIYYHHRNGCTYPGIFLGYSPTGRVRIRYKNANEELYAAVNRNRVIKKNDRQERVFLGEILP